MPKGRTYDEAGSFKGCTTGSSKPRSVAPPMSPRRRRESPDRAAAPCHDAVSADLVRPGGRRGLSGPRCVGWNRRLLLPGVADNSAFEHDCIERGMYVFMADNSVDAASLGDDADPQRHTFVKKFIGPVDDDRFMTMESWVASSGIQDSDDLMLQMDIEGAEFLAILTTPDSLLARFRIMVLEVHELDQL